MTASSPPPRRLRVLLIRHGETDHNVAGIIQGQIDTPLNAFGRLQASTTARHLSHVRLDRIITSPLQRARDTAQALLDHQPDSSQQLRLEQDARLQERAFGILEGKVYAGPVAKKPDSTTTTTGIEEKDSLCERLAGFWNELVTFPASPPPSPSPKTTPPPSSEQTQTQTLTNQHAQNPNDDADDDDNDNNNEQVIALISHGASISALLDQVLLAGQYIHTPPDFQPSRRANCSITEIVVPTITDRRPASIRAAKPAGHADLKHEWTIRPLHLGVQGAQQLLEIRNLDVQLAHCRQIALEAAANSNTDDDTQRTLSSHIETLAARSESLHARLEMDGVMAKLEGDVLRSPGGEGVVHDLGYGPGVGYVVMWADTTHLQGLVKSVEEQVLKKHGRGDKVNVDELVGK